MSTQAATIDEPRPRLSRDRVLASAIRMADEGGIESLTIRRLAQELGTRPMSLYYYVRSKDDILRGILEMVVREMRVASGEGEWRAAIRDSAISGHEVLLRHPWACTLMMDPQHVSAPRLAYMEALLRRLREAGLSAEDTDHAYHALDSHIIGFTLWQTGYSRAISSAPDLDQTFPALLKSYPYLLEHAQQHMRERRPGERNDYEFGLDLILESLEQMLKEGDRR